MTCGLTEDPRCGNQHDDGVESHVCTGRAVETAQVLMDNKTLRAVLYSKFIFIHTL